MDELAPVIARVAFVGVMVIGGSIFAFSTFIMAALKQVPDQEGIRAMQQINESVFTPWFMAPFFGTAALSLVAVVIATSNTDQRWWLSLLGAGALYFLGLFVVTAAGNVPLNNKLASVEATDPIAHEVWRRYLIEWTRWNHLRTFASIGSALLFVESLRLMG